MISIEPIIARLKAAGLRQVEGALEYAGLRQVPARLPAFFVVPSSERAGANELVGAVHQKVAHNFMVVIVMSAAGRQQAHIREALKDHCDTIDAALLGWTHPDARGACHYAGGDLLAADSAVLAWAARYSCTYHKRRT